MKTGKILKSGMGSSSRHTASSGTFKAMTTMSDEYEVASLHGETLWEEREADENFLDIAGYGVNNKASRDGDPEDDEEELFEEEDDDDDFDEEEDLESSRDKSRTKSKQGRRI